MSLIEDDPNTPSSTSNSHRSHPIETTEYYTQLFTSLDLNNDGRIDFHDLSTALQRGKNQNHHHHKLSLIKNFFRKSDLDKSGDVSIEEFLEYARKNEKQLRIVFNRFDINQDGKIDASEMQKVLQSELGVHVDLWRVKSVLGRMSSDFSEDPDTFSLTWEEFRDHLLLTGQSSLPEFLRYWRYSTFTDQEDFPEIPEDLPADAPSGIWWRHLVAGGVAGAVSRTVTAPLDRVKVFLPVHGRATGSMLMTVRSMLAEGGLISLWRGNGVNVLKIAPESALKFLAYEEGKRLLKGKSDRELKIEERFLAGSMAGAVSQSVIYPLEVIKTRLALRRTGETLQNLTLRMYDTQGLRMFYRGFIPNLLGILPYAGIDLAVYETLKRKASKTTQNSSVFVLLTCGTISSACGQMASYPLALVRTKLQASDRQNSMVNVFKMILKSEGLRGLYRGLLPNFIKVAPAVSISYVVYENVRVRLGVEMT